MSCPCHTVPGFRLIATVGGETSIIPPATDVEEEQSLLAIIIFWLTTMDQLILLTALEVGFWLLMTVNSQFRLEPFRFEPQLGLNVDRRDLRGFNMTSLPGTIPRLNMSLHVTTISQFYQSFHGPRCGYNDGLGCRCTVAQTCWDHICTACTGENLLEGLTLRMHVALDFLILIKARARTFQNQ